MNEENTVVVSRCRTWAFRLLYRQAALKDWLRRGAPGLSPSEGSSWTPAVGLGSSHVQLSVTGLAALVEQRLAEAATRPAG